MCQLYKYNYAGKAEAAAVNVCGWPSSPIALELRMILQPENAAGRNPVGARGNLL
jgi:hypothetical protein